MKIIKKQAIGENDNRILLIRNGQDLGACIPNKKEQAYVQKRQEQKKEVSILNHLDHLVIARSIDSKDLTLHNRLEDARKAGFGMHPILKDHESESSSPVQA